MAPTAFSRVTGRPGVCIAQNGPGITNFVTAIAAAYWAHSPVVMITPESGSATMGHGGFQETEQMPIFSKITKWQVHVNHPSRIAELTSRAFNLALAERGPVQVNIPRDYFYGELDINLPMPLAIERSAGGPESLEAAAKLLAGAKRPVILAGGGVIFSNGVEECKALAEYLSAPVASSYLHNDSFPASHHLAVGPLGYQGSKAAMKLIAKADVVLALGSRLGPFGTLPQHGIDYWPKNAQIIQVDADHRMLGLVRPASVAVCGDARLAAREILERVKRLKPGLAKNEASIAEIRAENEAWREELAKWPSPNEPGKIGPRRALAALRDAMPKNAMVSTDIGNVCSVSNSYLHFDEPGHFMAAMSFGNCGYAFPTAMGAKVGRPDQPAIAYIGDGAWGMALSEVMTCVREEIPVVGVVFNNNQWGAEKKNQVDYFGDRYVGSNLTSPDFAEVAKSMGANGITVSEEDQVGDALREAVKSNRCTILNINLTRELGDPFRRDAFKQPRRLLDKYKAHSAPGVS